MKNIISISLLFLVLNPLWSQTPFWEEDFDFVAVADQADGGSVSIDITNQGKDVADCISKAKQQALFTIIFKGYGKTNNASASASLSDMSKYHQNLDFFKNYLSANTSGLAFVNKAVTNTSKPASKISRKEIKHTTTVYIMKKKLREDLERQGYVESAASLVESFGYKPSIFVVPSEGWMKELGYTKNQDQHGQTKTTYDYIGASSDNQLTTIDGYISSRFGDVFDMKSLHQVVSNKSMDDAMDNLRSEYGEKVESDFDILASSASADIWLKVDLQETKISGGMETQYQLILTCQDPYTGSNVFTTEPQIIKTSGDNFAKLLNAAVNAATDDFRPRVINYLKEREVKGLQGIITFISANEDVNFKFSKMNYNGKSYTLETGLPGMLRVVSGNPAKANGVPTKSNMEFEIKIPAKVEDDFGGGLTPNSFASFANEVISALKKENSDYEIITESVGTGRVNIVFIEEQ